MLRLCAMSASRTPFVSLVNCLVLPVFTCLLSGQCVQLSVHTSSKVVASDDREEHRPIHEAIIAISSFKFFHWVVTVKTILLRGLNSGRFITTIISSQFKLFRHSHSDEWAEFWQRAAICAAGHEPSIIRQY